MRKYYWYFSAYIRKHGKIVLGSIIAAIIFFSIFIPTIIKLIEQKPRQYIGLVGNFSLENLPKEVLESISVGLTVAEKDGTVGPGLAERWVVENDGRTYRFVLKPNVKWHDGQTVKPEDLNYNFRNVEIVTTPNDVVFKLSEAFVPFPSIVAQPVIRYQDERYFFFFKRKMPIGVGKYRVVDYKLNGNELSEIVLDSTDKRHIYRFYLTEQQAITAFKHGRIDLIQDLAAPNELFDWDTVQVSETLRDDRYLAVFFDNTKPFFEKNVRQALSYALQKPTDETRAIGPINPESWVYLKSAKSYDYDRERALERILDSLPNQPLVFDLTTTANFQTEAEEIKKSWEEFGSQAMTACQESSSIKEKDICSNLEIKITIRVSNFPDTTNFDALLVGQEIPPDPDQYYLWHSEQETNFTHYKNTRIDSLLEKGRITAIAADRLAIYQEFQQFFLEDAPAVFIRHLKSYQVSRK